MVGKHPPAILIADALGLDFLNSIATPTDSTIDWIDSGEGLIAWLGEVGLVPAEALAELRGQALPGELDNIADQARQLREWFRSVVLRHKGRPISVDALKELAPLNRLLERDESYSRIVVQKHEGHSHLGVERMRRWRSPDSLLLPIGEALSKFVCDDDFTDVKNCEGPSCTLMFVDRTRGRTRRWCSMAICGNRAKQAVHRNKARSQN
jgi:predicted RNA-binding Zn ribbon-like protein